MNNQLTVADDYPDLEMAVVPAPGRGARRLLLRRARVAFRFFILLIVLILVNNFSPFGPFLVNYFLNGLQCCGAGFTFVLIFTCGYLCGVRHMEEVVDNPIN